MSNPTSDGWGPWETVWSSNLKRWRYNADKQLFEVVFKGGGIYRYNRVPIGVVNTLQSENDKAKSQMVQAASDAVTEPAREASVGQEFNRLVKNAGYTWEKIG
jgi:hypothetical protein